MSPKQVGSLWALLYESTALKWELWNILSDSVATVVTEGLLGNRYVNIQRGLSGKPVPTGGEIPAAQLKQVTFTDVIDSVSKVANCLNEEKHRAEENRITPRETVPRTRH
jgi:ABC-type transporter Mla subunit MlaD